MTIEQVTTLLQMGFKPEFIQSLGAQQAATAAPAVQQATAQITPGSQQTPPVPQFGNLPVGAQAAPAAQTPDPMDTLQRQIQELQAQVQINNLRQMINPGTGDQGYNEQSFIDSLVNPPGATQTNNILPGPQGQ